MCVKRFFALDFHRDLVQTGTKVTGCARTSRRLQSISHPDLKYFGSGFLIMFE